MHKVKSLMELEDKALEMTISRIAECTQDQSDEFYQTGKTLIQRYHCPPGTSVSEDEVNLRTDEGKDMYCRILTVQGVRIMMTLQVEDEQYVPVNVWAPVIDSEKDLYVVVPVIGHELNDEEEAVLGSQMKGFKLSMLQDNGELH